MLVLFYKIKIVHKQRQKRDNNCFYCFTTQGRKTIKTKIETKIPNIGHTKSPFFIFSGINARFASFLSFEGILPSLFFVNPVFVRSYCPIFVSILSFSCFIFARASKKKYQQKRDKKKYFFC